MSSAPGRSNLTSIAERLQYGVDRRLPVRPKDHGLADVGGGVPAEQFPALGGGQLVSGRGHPGATTAPGVQQPGGFKFPVGTSDGTHG